MIPFFIIILFILLLLLVFILVKFKNSKFESKFKINGGKQKHHLTKKLHKLKTNVTHNLTYSISGNDGLDYSILRNLLNSHSFKEIANSSADTSASYVDLSWCIIDIFNHNRYEPMFKTQTANLKSIFDNKYTNKLTHKHLLIQAINQYNPNLLPFIPTTRLLKDVHNIEIFQIFDTTSINGSQPSPTLTSTSINGSRPSPTIIKEGNAFAQKGVQVITTDKELQAIRKHLNLNTTIVSTYITNPLLWRGKKFHLRPYIVLYSKTNTCFVYDDYRVFTARALYKHGDWLNRDIHITGADPEDRSRDDRVEWVNSNKDLKDSNKDSKDSNKDSKDSNNSTLKDYNLSEHMLEKCNISLKKCIKEICTLITNLEAKPYDDSKFAFEIFGPDILLDSEGNAHLLEINNKCGFGLVGDKDTWPEYNKKRSHKIFSFIINNIILPHFL